MEAPSTTCNLINMSNIRNIMRKCHKYEFKNIKEQTNNDAAFKTYIRVGCGK
jgi:hypothetical protein